MSGLRRITIDPITRLEGHGKVEILLDEQGEVAQAWLQVPELRGFERFCVGRAAEEMPQLTAHVCGVCPAAHHLASVRALDAMYGVAPPVAARLLQHAYYNLFIFEDHLLHYWYMGGPDLVLGPEAPAPMRNVLGVMAAVGASLGRRILTVRKEARDLMALVSGRTVHPVFALPGGCSRALSPEGLAALRAAAPRLVSFAQDTLESFRAAVLENAGWWRTVQDEAYRVRAHALGMVDEEGALTFLDGTIRAIDPDGRELLRFAPADYLEHLAERVEPWSYAKFTFLKARGWTGFTEGEASGLYRVGPLARLAVARRMATPLAEAERQRLFGRLGYPAHQTLAFHWARLVEALQAAEAVQRLADDPRLAGREIRQVPRALAGPVEGVGMAEAPRGLLIHHYRADAAGLLTKVDLVVASQHNAGPIQVSVKKAAQGLIHGGRVDDGILNRLEMAFRAYDPCNACASHAAPGELPLLVTVRDHRGEPVAVLRRRVAAEEA